MVPLLHLPPEVLTHTLLEFIPHNTQIHLRLVCSEFNHFVWEHWKCIKSSYLIHFRMFDNQFLRIAQTYLNKLPNLRSITLQNLEQANQRFYDMESDGLIRGLNCLNNIEYLDCHKMMKVKPKFVSDLISSGNLVDTVTELILPQFWKTPIHLDFTPFTKLKRLTFLKGGEEGNTLKGLKLPSSLEYFECCFVATDDLVESLIQCKNLRELVLPMVISAGVVSKLLQNLDLTSVTMGGSIFRMDENVQYLTNVRNLKIVTAFNLKPFQSLRHLEKLTVDLRNDRLMQHQSNIDLLHGALCGLTHLKSIDFYFPKNMKHESQKTIFNSGDTPTFLKLETLKVKNGLSSKAIIDLVAFLSGPSLKEISLSDTYIHFEENLENLLLNSLACLKNCPLIEVIVLDIPCIELFKEFKAINTLKLKVLKGVSVDQKLLGLCPNKHTIEELDVSIVRGELNLSEFVNLRKLKLNSEQENGKIILPKSMQHLDIFAPDLSSNTILELSKLPFLKTLSLEMDYLEDKNIIEMINEMDENPPLTSLIIRGSQLLTNSIIRPIERKLVNLTTVLIDDCPKIRDCGEITLLEYEKRFVFSSLYDEFEQPDVGALESFVKANLGYLELRGNIEVIVARMKSQIEVLISSGKLTELYFTLVEVLSKGYLNGTDCKTMWFFYRHVINTYIESKSQRDKPTLIDTILQKISSQEFMEEAKEDILHCLSRNLHRFSSRFPTVALILLKHGRYEQILKYLPIVKVNGMKAVCKHIMKLFLDGRLRLLDYYNLSLMESLMDVICYSGGSTNYCDLIVSFYDLVIQTYLIKVPFSFPMKADLTKLRNIQDIIEEYFLEINAQAQLDYYIQSCNIIDQHELSTDELVKLYSPHFAGSDYNRIHVASNEFKMKRFLVEGHEWIVSIDSDKLSFTLLKPKLEYGKLFDYIRVQCCVIFPSGMHNFHVFNNKFVQSGVYTYHYRHDLPEEPFIICLKIIESKYYPIEEIRSLLGDKTIQEPEIRELATKSAWLARKIHKNKLVLYKTVSVITSTDLSDHAFASQELDIFESKHILYIRPYVDGKFAIDFGTYLSSSPHLKLSYLIANENLDTESIAISKINRPLYETHDLNLMTAQYEDNCIIGSLNIFEQGVYKPSLITRENGNTYYQFTIHLVIVLEDSLIAFKSLFPKGDWMSDEDSFDHEGWMTDDDEYEDDDDDDMDD